MLFFFSFFYMWGGFYLRLQNKTMAAWLFTEICKHFDILNSGKDSFKWFLQLKEKVKMYVRDENTCQVVKYYPLHNIFEYVIGFGGKKEVYSEIWA